MRTIAKLMTFAALVAITAGNPTSMIAQAKDVPAATQRWAGTWEGKVEVHPAVILTITESDKELQGSAVFYMLRRGDGGSTIEDKMTVPMTNPHLQNKTLSFQIIRKDHSQAGFTLELKSDNAAILRREGGGDASEVEMSKVH
jgi:hypothetical protein